MKNSNSSHVNHGIKACTVNAKLIVAGQNAQAQFYEGQQNEAHQMSRSESDSIGSLSERATSGGIKRSKSFGNKTKSIDSANKNNSLRSKNKKVMKSIDYLGDEIANRGQNNSNIPSKKAIQTKRLLLFIHGLAGHEKITWGLFPKLLREDVDIDLNYDIAFYSYPTSLFRLPFFSPAPRIQDLAAGLGSQIRNRYSHYKEITLACHSMGGLIARKCILDEHQIGRKLPAIRLALFAVPHNGAALAAFAKHLSWKQWQIAQLCRDSDFVDGLNESWVRLGLHEKVPTKYYIAAQDQIVDRLSSRSHWGNEQVEVIVNRGHADLVKPVASNDDVFVFFRNFLIESLLKS